MQQPAHQRTAARERSRAQEFEAFVAGAAGRLLHAATLLTAEPVDDNPRARRLLLAALSLTYARWDRLRGEDPYDRTRQELASRFAHSAWRHHRPLGTGRAHWLNRAGRVNRVGRATRPGDGVLARLTPQERLILVLRLYEGVAEEQTAALVGLPEERVRAICARATAAMHRTPRRPAPRLPEAAKP
ncbi:RNA polymerase subunit sigma-70 [Streptomyces sp. NBC_01387]|uniref:sigma factor-like helix-turn-helix DNA-binding protein n=1 Tax=unclassified Streptomyces TaxID=2593676 RepID=UPI002DDA3C9F|nr:sigma factor-like helix-turn-helix DNA-binding protein [Streptomyces sp. NBC_01766]WSC20216.1 RNA polymerase subunit sigma-70 [Streptomyces sp. NBC_01766]WSV54240.1 RNA polymerase subunit sigma-70 [Streptomyces sp. NBC_01014]